jgi:hypothetical protein
MYRGSSSSHARAYKKAGHTNENVFGALVGGTNEGLHPQGKTDWKDELDRTYSVKRGAGCKKWQIFLYGFDRIANDEDFLKIGNVGKLLGEALNSFPASYSKYLDDKNKIKQFLRKVVSDESSGLSILSQVTEEFEGTNSYLDSKVSLSKVTTKIRDELANPKIRSAFLQKSMFNNGEVSHLALSQGAFFEVYPREVAVEALTLGLSPGVSVAGTNKLDLNVAGQKIIMKSDRNVVEIEIRNDSDKHYRQVRFNMVTAPAIDLLHSITEADGSQKTNGVTWMRRRS